MKRIVSPKEWLKIFDSINDSICLIDPEGIITLCNRAMTELLEKPFSEIMGARCWELVHGTDKPIQGCPVLRMKKTRQRESMPFEIGDKHYNVVVDPFLDAQRNIISAVHIISDVSSSKKREKDLAESKARFEAIFNSISDGIVFADNERKITKLNPAVKKMWGYTSEELFGQTAELLYQSKHDYETMGQKRYSPSAEKTSSLYEMTYKRKDESLFQAESLGARVIDSFGKSIGYVGIHRDISERKMLEKQLRQAHKMEAVGTLAGGIAHEFNNILGIIVGNTELAMDECVQFPKALTNLQEIRNASLRARDVIKQILAFSRYSAPELKPLRLSVLVNETLRLLRSSVSSSMEICADIQSHEDLIMADVTQINQILMNLCTNGVYAMKDKGGELGIRLETVFLSIRDGAACYNLVPGKYVKLSVSDTGCGIEKASLDRIFDPYFTTRDVGEGSGMGLAVVHGIVTSHGGEIFVQSHVGKGTTFEIFFPVVKMSPVPEIKAEEPSPKGSERILFVDDERSLVTVAEKVLTGLGYRVTIKTDPVSALEYFQKHATDFDLIISDMSMPDMTGDQLALELMKIRPDIPVILCTGFSDRMNEGKAKKMGVRAFILKPATSNEMAKTIRKVLDDK